MSIELPSLSVDPYAFSISVVSKNPNIRGLQRSSLSVHLANVVLNSGSYYVAMLRYNGSFIEPITDFKNNQQETLQEASYFCNKYRIRFAISRTYRTYDLTKALFVALETIEEKELFFLVLKTDAVFSVVGKIIEEDKEESIGTDYGSVVTQGAFLAEKVGLFFFGNTVFPKKDFHIKSTIFYSISFAKKELSLSKTGISLGMFFREEGFFVLAAFIKRAVYAVLVVARRKETIENQATRLTAIFPVRYARVSQDSYASYKPIVVLAENNEERGFLVLTGREALFLERKNPSTEELTNMGEKIQALPSFPGFVSVIEEIVPIKDAVPKDLSISFEPFEKRYNAVHIDSLGKMKTYPVKEPFFLLSKEEKIASKDNLFYALLHEKGMILFQTKVLFPELQKGCYLDFSQIEKKAPILSSLEELSLSTEGLCVAFIDQRGNIFPLANFLLFSVQKEGRFFGIIVTPTGVTKDVLEEDFPQALQEAEENNWDIPDYTLQVDEGVAFRKRPSSESIISVVKLPAERGETVFAPALFSEKNKEGRRVCIQIYPPHKPTVQEAVHIAKTISTVWGVRYKRKKKGEPRSIKPPFVFIEKEEKGFMPVLASKNRRGPICMRPMIKKEKAIQEGKRFALNTKMGFLQS